MHTDKRTRSTDQYKQYNQQVEPEEVSEMTFDRTPEEPREAAVTPIAETWQTLLASLDEETLNELGTRIAPVVNRELGRLAVNERFS